MKVLRLTRHPADDAQLSELRRLFGTDVEVVDVSEPAATVQRIWEIIEANRPDVLDVVLPLELLVECFDAKVMGDIPVIRAKMIRTEQAEGRRADFTFSHYERVVEIRYVTQRL